MNKAVYIKIVHCAEHFEVMALIESRLHTIACTKMERFGRVKQMWCDKRRRHRRCCCSYRRSRNKWPENVCLEPRFDYCLFYLLRVCVCVYCHNYVYHFVHLLFISSCFICIFDVCFMETTRKKAINKIWRLSPPSSLLLRVRYTDLIRWCWIIVDVVYELGTVFFALCHFTKFAKWTRNSHIDRSIKLNLLHLKNQNQIKP